MMSLEKTCNNREKEVKTFSLAQYPGMGGCLIWTGFVGLCLDIALFFYVAMNFHYQWLAFPAFITATFFAIFSGYFLKKGISLIEHDSMILTNKDHLLWNIEFSIILFFLTSSTT